MADTWPLGSYLELGALPSAVPCARLHAKQMLWEWGFTELSEAVELLVSELTTNAVRVSKALDHDSPIRLWLLSDKTQVLILVWDGSPRPPVRIEITEDAEGGRGLLLVETLSEQWGWYPSKDNGGKWVWCRVVTLLRDRAVGQCNSSMNARKTGR
jgi:anti-sigma regulatory factor (Ser/Thr protein kinase)